MILDDDKIAEAQAKIVSELGNRLRQRLMQTALIHDLKENRSIWLQSLASIMDKVSAGALLIALFPDELSWRPVCALGACLICYPITVKLLALSKKE